MTESLASRIAAAAALRQLGELMVTRDVADVELDQLTSELSCLSERLVDAPPRSRAPSSVRREYPQLADGDVAEHFVDCFVNGDGTPVGLKGRGVREGDAVIMTVTIPATFEGRPGYAHGGALAAVYNDLVDLVIAGVHRTMAPTVRLDISFKRPVPTGRPVEFRGWLRERVGRKWSVSAKVTADGVLCGEAEGLLLSLSDRQFDERFRADDNGAR